MEDINITKTSCKKKESYPAADLPVSIHLCESRATKRSARSEAAKQYRMKRGTERRREKKEEEGTNLRSAMMAATLAAPMGQGKGSLHPPRPSPFQQPGATTIRLPPFFLETSESPTVPVPSDHEQQQLLQSQARAEQCLAGMGRLLSDSPARAE